ncbi:DNA topoisomerase 1-like [Phalaenopsis equestris]|uniref:DNA topoisomerase 1-like n=1 Tax=Phalaenopsis equestris TaxID=78828 RepID=UPI0009E53496|nr:DNA topoisomerase 1-like [Phalaenopsis equestris]
MIEEAKHAVKKEEEDDLDGPISAISRKSLKKMEPIFKDRLDDDDDVPLAFSTTKKNKPSNYSKMKKEEPEDDEDEKPLKKMEGLKKRLSDSPKVKKEEREDDDDEMPLKKKAVLKNVSKPKIVKKEALMDSEKEDEGNKKSRKRKRTEEKRTVVKSRKVEASKEKFRNDKKEKKAYELPGQKHDPPELRDPLRIFYETLYEKVPTSEMAAICALHQRAEAKDIETLLQIRQGENETLRAYITDFQKKMLEVKNPEPHRLDRPEAGNPQQGILIQPDLLKPKTFGEVLELANNHIDAEEDPMDFSKTKPGSFGRLF